MEFFFRFMLVVMFVSIIVYIFRFKKALFKAITFSLVGIFLLIILIFHENIYGYYRFKKICSENSGLHVYQKLKKNVGWEVSEISYNPPYYVAHINGVKFVRYKDKKDLKFYDVKYIRGPVTLDTSYEKTPSDPSEKTIYRTMRHSERLPNALRLSETLRDIVDINTGEIHVRKVSYAFSLFDQDRSILGAPSSNLCGEVGIENKDYNKIFEN